MGKANTKNDCLLVWWKKFYLEHSHTHWFTSCPLAVFPQRQGCRRDWGSQSWKYLFLSEFWQKKKVAHLLLHFQLSTTYNFQHLNSIHSSTNWNTERDICLVFVASEFSFSAVNFFKSLRPLSATIKFQVPPSPRSAVNGNCKRKWTYSSFNRNIFGKLSHVQTPSYKISTFWGCNDSQSRQKTQCMYAQSCLDSLRPHGR